MFLFLVIQTVEILLGSTLKPCLRPAIYTGQFLASDLLCIQVSFLPPTCYLYRSVLPPICYLYRSVSYLRPAIYSGHFIASDLLSIQVSFASELLSIQVSFCLRPLLKQVSFLRHKSYTNHFMPLPQTCSLPVILNIASDLLFMQACLKSMHLIQVNSKLTSDML